MPARRIASVIICSALGVALVGAQQSGQSSGQGSGRAPANFEAYSTAVLVDVVVRDGKGHPVTDLTAADFELQEDGVLQVLGSFTRVSRGSGIGINVALKEPGRVSEVGRRPSPEDGTPEKNDTSPSVTALVFDSLSAEAVNLCQRAALDVLPMTATGHARVGVFATSPTVMPLQIYTDDPTLVRQAVRRVMPAGSSQRPDFEALQALRDRRETLDQQASNALSQQAAGGAGLAGTASNIGQLEMERHLAVGQLRMLQAFDTLDREQRGLSSTNALFAVLQSLVELPGRKTLVLFSEGLPASPALQANLQAVVEAANRANITVYAIDASGLRAVSGTLETRREIEEMTKERLRQLTSASDYTDQPIMRLVERAEDMLKLDSQTGLARLAHDTGGFLVSETNNLRGALRRIDEDTRFHYLLTYAPANSNFDGRFRAIDVKVKRPGVNVFARNGYRALRRPVPLPVMTYEAPALAVLDSSKLPNTFAFSSAVMSFPEQKRPGLSPLVVRLKTDVLTYEEHPDTGTYEGEATIVARYRDAAGDIVYKNSQQYHLSGRLSELESARKGEILFYREPTLLPGTYTVEVAIMDGAGHRASTRVATVEVPRASMNDLRMSSLMLIGKAERVTEGRDPANPLYAGDVLFYPSGGEPFSRATDRQVGIFYTVYPGAGFGAPQATLELQRNGQSIATTPVALGQRDAQGRIQQVTRIPLATLTSGTYELRVLVHEGKSTLTRSTFFQVRD
jgi:VWFA-related protein